MSEGVTKILGYSPDEVTLSFFLDIIHPDDKPYFLNFESKIAAFFTSLPYDKIKKYKTQYDIRIRTKNNKYICILQQAVQIEYDEANFYRTFDLQTDISHIKMESTPCLSIIGLDGEPSYYNVQNDTETSTKSYDLFTRRERDISKRIVEGRNSKEIADELYISLHTVNTHRKNILIKADCKSPVELVIKSIREGWV
ncbi:LuxR C-terminal-related transcriptional regulator [Daejeonella sp.]|uniref:LuxR C-terminal-related transcriptional regulator n=1 Tax=Daejeonella sp. TaxID=2805397 RepID=UPI0030C3433E